MEHLAYLAVISVFTAVAIFIWFREHGKVVRLSEEKNEIEGEERRMFGFLHGLGEKLQDDNSPSNMHRYVVDGVVEVINADAGILYLLDGETNQLVPVCQTLELAPVIPIPPEIAAIREREDAESQYRSFLRLSALKPGEHLVGRSLESDTYLYVENLIKDEEYAEQGDGYQDGVSFLAAALVYGHKRVGVLAMTRGGSQGFSSNDREVFGSIAEQSSFALGSAIIHAEAAEKRRMERELTQASEIQRVLLPFSAPALNDYELAAEYHAARIVSGDYYDYIPVDEDRYGIAIGDVCGKGIAASLIMAMCRSNLRSRAHENLSPASVLHSVNQSIFPDIKEDMFVSLLYLILEKGSNEVTVARAGHEPPILYRRASKSIELIEPPGMAAGIDGGPVFKRSVKDHRFTMNPGDILLLYTDGLNEAIDRDGDEFGMDRLNRAVEKYSSESSETLIRSIVEEVKQFSMGISQTDDITLIAIEKR
ncbi:MAG: GAF domain-containing SpoIIE family protein phosphatase [Verrucomicrobiota bacterium]|nr:GAF domain-containing SpoIIE family protein phosphatase [Verrucomicrobiota bacterium]